MVQIRLACAIALMGVVLGACAAPIELKPTITDGWTVYSESYIHKTIDCQDGKVQLNGDRLETHLTNNCQAVRVAGAHSDIEVDLAPDGSIEITGSHNDVVWHQMVAGSPPQLLDRGTSNTFHPAQ